MGSSAGTPAGYDFAGLGYRPGDGVVISGAASGIGRATALAAARSGLRVSAWDLNQEGLESLVQDISFAGGTASSHVVDVTDPRQVAAAMERSGQCTYLVNNAGPGAQADLTFSAGIVAAVGSMQDVTEQWLAMAAGTAGALVNVSSMAGNSSGGLTKDFYAAAKAGIAGYTRQLSVRLEGRPRVNAVAPGFIATPRTQPYLERAQMRAYADRSPLKRPGSADEVAAAILFLLSPAASNINGVLLPVDGGADNA